MLKNVLLGFDCFVEHISQSLKPIFNFFTTLELRGFLLFLFLIPDVVNLAEKSSSILRSLLSLFYSSAFSCVFGCGLSLSAAVRFVESGHEFFLVELIAVERLHDFLYFERAIAFHLCQSFPLCVRLLCFLLPCHGCHSLFLPFRCEVGSEFRATIINGPFFSRRGSKFFLEEIALACDVGLLIHAVISFQSQFGVFEDFLILPSVLTFAANAFPFGGRVELLAKRGSWWLRRKRRRDRWRTSCKSFESVCNVFVLHLVEVHSIYRI